MNRRHHLKLVAALTTVLLASSATADDDVRLDLVLRGAVFQKEAPGTSDPALLVDVKS